jgi:hypothetical protein
MKSKLLLVMTFAVGIIVGAIAHRVLVQNEPKEVPRPATPLWNDTEEATLARMNSFQERLNQLEAVRPDSVEALSKQAEAARGIEDILMKYREAKLAKYAPFIGASGTALTAMITGIGGWLIAKFGSRSTRTDGQQITKKDQNGMA